MGENAFWSAELEGQPNEEDVALCDQPDVQDDQEGQGYNASRPGGSADGDEDDEEEALGDGEVCSCCRRSCAVMLIRSWT
jgi:hypothetical protein